jgi:signal transduction histidine kinase
VDVVAGSHPAHLEARIAGADRDWQEDPAYRLPRGSVGRHLGAALRRRRRLKLWVLRLSGQPDHADRILSFPSLFTWHLLYAFEWEVLLYWGVLAANHAIRASRELRRRELYEARLEARLVAARLESLQRQLHPHFVFNTLNAITALLHRDPVRAESMLVRLGDLLRAVFRSQAQQEVPLGRELDLLQQYMEIQRVRFGGTLTCEIDVPPATLPALVPVLVLQPLVENAVKHGFAGRAGGVIRVSARRAGDRLELTVTDNGRGASALQGTI